MNKVKKIERLSEIVSKFYKIGKFKSAIDADNAITPLQTDALLYLSKHPKSTVGSLGKHLYISSSAVAQLTDRLAKSGFIARKNDLLDRRITLIYLTQEGRNVFPRLYRDKIKKIKIAVSYISENDLNDLIRIYSKILDNLEGRNSKK